MVQTTYQLRLVQNPSSRQLIKLKTITKDR